MSAFLEGLVNDAIAPKKRRSDLLSSPAQAYFIYRACKIMDNVFAANIAIFLRLSSLVSPGLKRHHVRLHSTVDVDLLRGRGPQILVQNMNKCVEPPVDILYGLAQYSGKRRGERTSQTSRRENDTD